MKVVYKHNFGLDTFGEIRETEDGYFQCYETPLYGGDFVEIGILFTDKDIAIEYLLLLT